MPRNIVIYSDGTGQDGGVRPDQRLSNVYKLYRATRIGPDSSIDPCDQIAFYDAGLGTDDDVHGWERFSRAIRKILASVAGRGIATNIADCYEFILNHWSPGDRIFIVGFSRGAYTARCVAQVISLCGVPTHASGDKHAPFPRFSRAAREVAERAVHQVYEHGAGHPRGDFEAERDELGRRFREEFGSDDKGVPNAHPHFIGVFDTVAALGAKGWKYAGQLLLIWSIGIFTAASISALVAAPFFIASSSGWLVFWTVTAALAICLLVRAELQAWRYIDDWPTKGARRRQHRIEWHAENYDRGLSRHVGYARQASAIDEDRADFPRVPWGRNPVIRDQLPGEPPPAVQLFFAGNHSDIGGSYPEEESRLSDLALQWMVDEATSIPGPLIVDASKLRTSPDAGGMQHSERFAMKDRKLAWVPKWAPKWLRDGWELGARKPAGYPVHPSVFERFAATSVVKAEGAGAYRPDNLSADERFAPYFSTAASADPMDLLSATYSAGDGSWSGRLSENAGPLKAALKTARVKSAAILMLPPNPIEEHDQYRDKLALSWLDRLIERAGLAALPITCADPADAAKTRAGRLLLGAEIDEARRQARSIGQMTTIIIDANGAATALPSIAPANAAVEPAAR